MLYPSALEFLKSEVPYLRYDLREVLQLSGHMRKSKFDLQVHFRMLYPSALEFFKSEVPYLRYDLQEVLQLSGHLESQNSVYRYTLGCSTHQLWNFWNHIWSKWPPIAKFPRFLGPLGAIFSFEVHIESKWPLISKIPKLGNKRGQNLPL